MCNGVCRLVLEKLGTRKLWQRELQSRHYVRSEEPGDLSTSPNVRVCV